MIYHVVEILRVIVEGWHGRHDDRAHARELQHIFEMNVTERRFAHDERQFAPFFQDHIRRAMNQIVAVALCDGGERSHAARRDDHAEREKRATGDNRALIAATVVVRRHLPDFFDRVRRFVRERARSPLAHHQMSLHA